MAVRKSSITQPGFWFLTFTCGDWLPLFELTSGYDIVYNWFDHLRRAGHEIAGYVIMPNHVHLLLAWKGGRQTLNTVVSNGKRFMAYELVSRLENQGRHDVLQRLANLRTASEEKAEKKHKVFETSFDALLCTTDKFILQKLDYIHNNPCVKRWKITDDPTKYLHSSAFFYETGRPGVYKDVFSFKELEEGSWHHLNA